MSYDIQLTGGKIYLDDQNGDIEIVSNSDKLIQSILKELSTILGSDLFDPSRGSELTSRNVGESLDPAVFITKTTSDITRTIEALRELQERQATQQFWTDAEMVSEIEDLIVEQDSIEPRQYNVTIKVLSRSLTPVKITFTIQQTI